MRREGSSQLPRSSERQGRSGTQYILSEQEARAEDGRADLSESERLEQLIRDVTGFQLRFCDAEEVVITDIMKQLGLKGRPKEIRGECYAPLPDDCG